MSSHFRRFQSKNNKSKRLNRKEKWIHFSNKPLCGVNREYGNIPHTDILNKVTCERCIEILKESNWYCPIHGFIECQNVTNDEKCSICNTKL